MGGPFFRYTSPEQVLQEFYQLRLVYYNKRKTFIVAQLQKELAQLSNKSRFILAVVEGDFVLVNRTKSDILAQLVRDGYTLFPKVETESKSRGSGLDDTNEPLTTERALSDGYSYLLNMSLWSLTKEKVDYAIEQTRDKQAVLDTLLATSEQQLWANDLDKLLTMFATPRESQVTNDTVRRDTKRFTNNIGPLVDIPAEIPTAPIKRKPASDARSTTTKRKRGSVSEKNGATHTS